MRVHHQHSLIEWFPVLGNFLSMPSHLTCGQALYQELLPLTTAIASTQKAWPTRPSSCLHQHVHAWCIRKTILIMVFGPTITSALGLPPPKGTHHRESDTATFPTNTAASCSTTNEIVTSTLLASHSVHLGSHGRAPKAKNSSPAEWTTPTANHFHQQQHPHPHQR